MKNYLDTDGLTLYDTNIKNYIDNMATFPFTVLTADTTLPDDIGVNRMKFYLINNSSTIKLTMPGDSSRQYVILMWNVIAAALVAAGKNPHYETASGGGVVSMTYTSSAEPYMLISVMRLS